MILKDNGMWWPVPYPTQKYGLQCPEDPCEQRWYKLPSEVIKDDASVEKFNSSKIKESLREAGVDVDHVVFFDGFLKKILGIGEPYPFAFTTADIKICIDRYIKKYPDATQPHLVKGVHSKDLYEQKTSNKRIKERVKYNRKTYDNFGRKRRH